ncbi:hypothetical protein LO763_22395 [Glycomyces sp. A-F 0318]|uniref:hypothetical protein n=1 Tax=Glycomyces amatae TaxID=2881355 RepID=UPI001E40CB3F|nr:hypothetical protein [Glycomyces amatae]MCD0446369.1 hypothetical protein [Glycomyces amatae]
MSATTTTALGEGLIGIEFPQDLLDPGQYVWTDVVALTPSTGYDQPDVAFPAELAGIEGTLVAVVTAAPRRQAKAQGQTRRLSWIDEHARRGADIPDEGAAIVLGHGPVRLRERFAGGRPTRRERTAIGVGATLEAGEVRSVHGLWVRLELRQ